MERKKSSTKQQSDDVLELVYQQLFEGKKKPKSTRTKSESSNGGSKPVSRLSSITSRSIKRSGSTDTPSAASSSPSTTSSPLDQIEAELVPDLWAHREKIINLSKLIILDHLAKICSKEAPEIRGKLNLEDTQKIQKLLSETKESVDAFIDVIESEIEYIRRKRIAVNEKANTIKID